MTRADAIMAAVRGELDKRRKEIDADGDMRALTLVIRMSEKSGLPFRVLYRPESESDLDTPRRIG